MERHARAEIEGEDRLRAGSGERDRVETPKAVRGELDSVVLEHDELAGVVDLFGALTRAELDTALSELAFKHDEPIGDTASRIAAAVEAYRLVAFERVEGVPVAIARGDLVDRTLLAAGPTAFPRLPEGGADLPHILDVSTRSIDRAALGDVIEERFRTDAARAVADDDTTRMAQLLDVSYDVEAWGPVELGETRDRLDAALDASSDAPTDGDSAPIDPRSEE